VRSRNKCNIQETLPFKITDVLYQNEKVQHKWNNCSHTALCSQVFSEDFQSNIYSNIFPCSHKCSSCSHECHM